MTLVCLALGDLGTYAETIMNAKTARDLSRMTEKLRSLHKRKETAEALCSPCLEG